MIPKWIVEVLGRELPQLSDGDRDRVAEALHEGAMASAGLRAAVLGAIQHSAERVLASRSIRDGGGDIAGELARNSAQSVIFAIGEG